MIDLSVCSVFVCFRWFELKTHAQTGKDDWMYTGDYTARNWDSCPDIF